MEQSDKLTPISRHRIEIKVSKEEKELIVRGAAAAKLGISEFVRIAAQEAARKALTGIERHG